MEHNDGRDERGHRAIFEGVERDNTKYGDVVCFARCVHACAEREVQTVRPRGNASIAEGSQHDSIEQYQEKGMHLHYNEIYDQNRSFHATVAQSKNSPFGVNTKIELKNITTAFDNTDI